MNTAISGTGDQRTPESPLRSSPSRAFAAILGRDLFVTGTTLPSFVARVVMQPFFFVFVFGKILTSLSFVKVSYVGVLIPGIMALTVFLTALQAIALPLVIDFGFTKEIEDRLMAPLPTIWVAVEKVVFASLQALLAGAVMFPISLLVIGSLPFRTARVGLVIAFLVLGSLAGAALGLIMGTVVDARRITVVFSLVLTPLIFTGCSQYPWPSLHRLVWFQYVTLLNPLTYTSEGMRSAMVPRVAHMDTWVAALVLVAVIAVALVLGFAGFARRAQD